MESREAGGLSSVLLLAAARFRRLVRRGDGMESDAIACRLVPGLGFS